MNTLFNIFAGPIISASQEAKSIQNGRVVAIIAVILALAWLFLLDNSYKDNASKRAIFVTLALIIIAASGYGLFLLTIFLSTGFL